MAGKPASLAPVDVQQSGLGEQLSFVLRLGLDPTVAVITINGELDIAAAAQLDEAIAALRAEPPQEILIDLSGLSFLDSSGIRALLRAQAFCDAGNCRLMMFRGPAQVERILRVANVADRFCFVD